jgi:uncharacterized protein YkwD
MKMSCLFSIIAVLIIAIFVFRDAHAAELKNKPRPEINISRLEKQIHDLVNSERKKSGLASLGWNKKLSAIDRKHSMDMAEKKYFSHYSPEGKDFLYRYEQAGFQCNIRIGNGIYLGGENIFQANLYDSVTYVNGAAYYDWNTEVDIANQVVRGWMNSALHRKNILTPHWNTEGIGISISADGMVFVTQNFC